MKKLAFILILLMLISMPVNADREAITDYKAHQVAEQYINLCEYEKARMAHDWLIRNVRFEFTENCYSTYGALMDGKAVCQGYALAYREILLHLEIPCNVIIGTAGDRLHAWNLITVNGIGYFVDVVWDDKDDGKIYYEWFMLTAIRDHYAMFELF